MLSGKKILILANDTTYVYNSRDQLLDYLVKTGNEVVVVSKLLSLQEELKALGCRLIDVDTGRRGTNPIHDLSLLKKYRMILKEEQPDMVLGFNIKPNIYGGFACKRLKIPFFVNITGLGTALEKPGLLSFLVIQLYKLSLSKAACVFFQNTDNQAFFTKHNILTKSTETCLLPGSGVNLQRYQLMPYPTSETIHFLCVARLMKQKGIDLYLAAAKEISQLTQPTVFHLCGFCDDPAYLEMVEEAEEAGYVKYHGEQKEMEPYYAQAHCVVLPSFSEGMSNVLLEAAACGRPIITSDRSGCKETVDAGISGFVVPVEDEGPLIQAIKDFMALSTEERRAMGLAGRAKIEREFDRGIVVQEYVNVLTAHDKGEV